MSHIASIKFVSHKNLSQQRTAYFGDCSICHEDNIEAISIHLTEQEVYEPQRHGQELFLEKMYGIFKECSIARSENFEIKAELEQVFHEIGYDQNQVLHVYAPIHTACRRCLDRLKSEQNPICPICRFDLKPIYASKKKHSEAMTCAPVTTARERRQEQITALRARPDLEIGTEEVIYSQSFQRAYRRSPAFTARAIASAQQLGDIQEETTE